jgi:hypothetical protein
MSRKSRRTEPVGPVDVSCTLVRLEVHHKATGELWGALTLFKFARERTIVPLLQRWWRRLSQVLSISALRAAIIRLRNVG